MSNILSDACVRVAKIEGYGVYARSRNNNTGLKYVVTHGERVLFSCANNGAGGNLDIRWRYRGGRGPEPILPSAVVEFVEDLVRSEDNAAIERYNRALAKRGVPEHSWARHVTAMAV